MSPTGAPDPLFVLARRVLLDALEALGPQRNALVLVGAQAVYLHTGPAGLAVPEFTTDADIAINPELLTADPRLTETLEKAGFRADADKVGTWLTTRPYRGGKVDVMLDLMVPDAVGGPGRRGARLGVHGNHAARKAKGLEAALTDSRRMRIESLDPLDERAYEVAVAGPAALLIAKLHKISERQDDPDRLQDKDALDVLRLLRAIPTTDLAAGLEKALAGKISAAVAREAFPLLQRLFARPESAGSRMAARAATPMESTETTAASCAALAGDLLANIRGRR